MNDMNKIQLPVYLLSIHGSKVNIKTQLDFKTKIKLIF